jgi:hypothetical protein
MSDADSAKTLAEVQRQRDAARAKLRGDVATLRGDLAERSIPARIGDRAAEIAVESAETAIDVAKENKIVVGLTVAGLLGWFLRRPIVRLFEGQTPTASNKFWPFDKFTKD